MKTDVITVSSRGNRMDAALAQVDKVCAYKGLNGKNSLHLHLLAEEMMGMMRSITGETTGQFWIEDEDDVYSLHLAVNTSMNSGKRDQLLSAATSGKNESAKGLMGHLRDFFDRESDEDVAALSSSLLMPEMYDQFSSPTLEMEWTMARYESGLASRVEQDDPAAKEAWDELEKSVVAHVADDVKVSIRGRSVEMIIIKKLA